MYLYKNKLVKNKNVLFSNKEKFRHMRAPMDIYTCIRVVPSRTKIVINRLRSDLMLNITSNNRNTSDTSNRL